MKTVAWLGATAMIIVGCRSLFANIIIPCLGIIVAYAIALTLMGIGIWFFTKGRSERTKGMAIVLMVSICSLWYHRIL